MSASRAGPLAGLKVVEMAGLAPGPFCAMMLADLGAEVLRIARPGAVEAESAPTSLVNRSRRCITLDLKAESGRTVLRRLLTGADAFIEGFRPGVMERLGLGPEACLALNPRLVYGRMTGWGQEGPLAQAAGHDINYIALTGALHSMGRAGEPPVIPLNLVGDFGGGGLYLAFGIVCALLEATRSGRGQVVDAAMVDGAASLMTYLYGLRAAGEWSDVRGQNVVDGGAPWYQVYETKDREYVCIAAFEPPFYEALLRLTGLEGTPGLPAQHDRARWPELRARLAEVFLTKTRAEWCATLEGSHACFAPVLSMGEAARHPHLRARSTLIDVEGVTQPAPAPRFSRTPADRPTPPSAPERDPAAVLESWGFTGADVALQAQAGAFGAMGTKA